MKLTLGRKHVLNHRLQVAMLLRDDNALLKFEFETRALKPSSCVIMEIRHNGEHDLFSRISVLTVYFCGKYCYPIFASTRRLLKY